MTQPKEIDKVEADFIQLAFPDEDMDPSIARLLARSKAKGGIQSYKCIYYMTSFYFFRDHQKLHRNHCRLAEVYEGESSANKSCLS